MLHPKVCHQGLKPSTKFFGLELLDALLLFPVLYVCGVLLHQFFLGLVATLVMAAIIRIIKWGRLPGYTLDLALYLVVSPTQSALGYDPHAPQYPLAPSRPSRF